MQGPAVDKAYLLPKDTRNVAAEQAVQEAPGETAAENAEAARGENDRGGESLADHGADAGELAAADLSRGGGETGFGNAQNRAQIAQAGFAARPTPLPPGRFAASGKVRVDRDFRNLKDRASETVPDVDSQGRITQVSVKTLFGAKSSFRLLEKLAQKYPGLKFIRDDSLRTGLMSGNYAGDDFSLIAVNPLRLAADLSEYPTRARLSGDPAMHRENRLRAILFEEVGHNAVAEHLKREFLADQSLQAKYAARYPQESLRDHIEQYIHNQYSAVEKRIPLAAKQLIDKVYTGNTGVLHPVARAAEFLRMMVQAAIRPDDLADAHGPKLAEVLHTEALKTGRPLSNLIQQIIDGVKRLVGVKPNGKLADAGMQKIVDGAEKFIRDVEAGRDTFSPGKSFDAQGNQLAAQPVTSGPSDELLASPESERGESAPSEALLREALESVRQSVADYRRRNPEISGPAMESADAPPRTPKDVSHPSGTTLDAAIEGRQSPGVSMPGVAQSQAAEVPPDDPGRSSTGADAIGGKRIHGIPLDSSHIRAFKKWLDKVEIEFLMDSNELEKAHPDAWGTFEWERTPPRILLRDDATLYEMLHEIGHASQWVNTGQKVIRYRNIPKSKREQYVYDWLRTTPVVWNVLSTEEQMHAMLYAHGKGEHGF